MKYILWGCGKCADLIWNEIKHEVVLIIDNNSMLWGTLWNGFIINSPKCLEENKIVYDKVIIASVEWRIIRKQLIDFYGVQDKKIDNTFFKKRQALLELVDKFELNDRENRYIEYIKKNPIDIFNASFCDRYIEYSHIEINYDIDKKLYYVMHAGKRMYFSKKYTSPKSCAKYYNYLLMEQDENSPHRYRTKDFDVKYGDVVLDAGVAEGNFALEIVDYVERLYLVEADEDWIEALSYTFESYKDKVEIIKGFLGNGSKGTTTIDQIIGEDRLNFIKMDIEGFEKEALEGAQKTVQKWFPNLVICTYHNEEDYVLISQKLERLDYKLESSDGYMIMINMENYNEVEIPVLVKGVVRGYKNE